MREQRHSNSPFIYETGSNRICGLKQPGGGTDLFVLTASQVGAPVDGVRAALAVDMVAADADLTFTARQYGAQGNFLTVAFVNPGAANHALEIFVDGNAIRIVLATGAGGAISSTAIEVAAAIAAHERANELVAVTYEGTGLGVVNATPFPAALAGGVTCTPGALHSLRLSADGSRIYRKISAQAWETMLDIMPPTVPNVGTVRMSYADGQAFIWDDGQDFSQFGIPSGITSKGTRRYKIYVFYGDEVISGFCDLASAGETLGADLVVNGAMAADTDWTKGDGWTIGDGVLTKALGAESQCESAADIAMVKGKLYKLTFDMENAVDVTGYLTFLCGGVVVGSWNTTGAKERYFTELTGGNIKIKFHTGTDWGGTIDNVVLKEVTDVAENEGIKIFNAEAGGAQNIIGGFATKADAFSMLQPDHAITYKLVPQY